MANSLTARSAAANSPTARPQSARPTQKISGKAAIPANYLAADDTFTKHQVGAGDEMMALGFPRGLAANQAGFPILRAGRGR